MQTQNSFITFTSTTWFESTSVDFSQLEAIYEFISIFLNSFRFIKSIKSNFYKLFLHWFNSYSEVPFQVFGSPLVISSIIHKNFIELVFYAKIHLVLDLLIKLLWIFWHISLSFMSLSATSYQPSLILQKLLLLSCLSSWISVIPKEPISIILAQFRTPMSYTLFFCFLFLSHN